MVDVSIQLEKNFPKKGIFNISLNNININFRIPELFTTLALSKDVPRFFPIENWASSDCRCSP